MKQKLLLKNFQAPGDLVMLTAAVRDLHACYPGGFLTDVRTSCPALWQNNPYLTPLEESDPEVTVLTCHYPLIHRSNEVPCHMLGGFVDFLNQRLDLQIQPTLFHGDLHLSQQEKDRFSPVEEKLGEQMPYWVIVAGGKDDFTIKWWSSERFQAVVDAFRGRLTFVQVGEAHHVHPALEGVVDLRGQTDIRGLMRLVYHAGGVLCPVTFLMHLAAATETEDGYGKPCVVVAGGREPPHWEAYPGHQFLHTVGMLECCRHGGCWRSRTLPLGDGDEKDNPENLCLDVVGNLPRCMDQITPKRVIEAIEGYYQGGRLSWPDKTLESVMEKRKRDFQPAGAAERTDPELDPATAPKRADELLASLSPYPANYNGGGIVICGGGVKHFTTAWVTINRLRDLGSRLPIELWHLGAGELNDAMRRLVEPLGVRCVDACQVRERHPVRRLAGWELKAFALLHSTFREVLLLDADNVPACKPDGLFEDDEYRRIGAVFWPDYGRLDRHRSIWRICGVAYRDEPEFESGQILVDKARCWTALRLALWYNEHSDFFYQHVHGDKETFHMAFLKSETPYARPEYPIEALPGTMCQHDFQGRRIFQHRNMARFDYHSENPSIPGFKGEEACFRHLAELRRQWSGHVENDRTTDQRQPSYETVVTELTGTTFEYHRVGYDRRPMTFHNDGTIGQGADRLEVHWYLTEHNHGFILEIGSKRDIICRLQRGWNGTWKGHWLHYEQMPVEIIPIEIRGDKVGQGPGPNDRPPTDSTFGVDGGNS